MRTKINRPAKEGYRDPGVTGLIQQWYDLGYSDALEDWPDLDSEAYDKGYENGLEDALKIDQICSKSEDSIQTRLSSVEACLAALMLGKN